MSYPNFNAELAKHGHAKRVLASIWKCREATVYDKLNGKAPLYVEELLLARNALFPKTSLDYLLATEEEKLCRE